MPKPGSIGWDEIDHPKGRLERKQLRPDWSYAMRFLRYLALSAVVTFALASASKANAQVAVGVGIGGPPVCSYGYYDYYPYACAPYGYYGPEWFNGGIFIGAGPWFHAGWGYRGGWGGYGYRGGYYGGYHAGIGYGGGFHGAPAPGGFHGAPPSGGFHGAPGGNPGFHGGGQVAGGFHGGAAPAFHGGGGGFHGGGGGSHGGHR
jgi:hypothetical protein